MPRTVAKRRARRKASSANVVTTGCRARKLARSPHQATGTAFRNDLRLALYLRDNFTCVHCLKDVRDVPQRGRALDHVVPCAAKARPDNSPSNVVTACVTCNSARGHKTIRQFHGRRALAVLERIAAQTSIDVTPYRVMARELIAEYGSYGAALAALAR